MRNYDYLAPLDRPEVLRQVFFPRKEFRKAMPGIIDLNIGVEEDITISSRLYPVGKEYPTILYFHGNGEVVSDYDFVAPVFNQVDVNLFVVDYRGYGASLGTPSYASMLKDAHTALDAVKTFLKDNSYSPDLYVMGRSLGSAPAIELAAYRSEELKGLIVESGFATMGGLARRLGFTVREEDEEKLPNLGSMRKVALPTLILHGEWDSLIPFDAAVTLYANCPSAKKKLVPIEQAEHNDIMIVNPPKYFGAIEEFILAES